MKLETAIRIATLNGSFSLYQSGNEWLQVKFNPATGVIPSSAWPTGRELDNAEWEPVIPDAEVTKKAEMLRSVKAGDRVWVHNGHGARGTKDILHTVKKVTPTQIVLEPGGDFDRYDRFTAYRKGRLTWTPSIVAVATKSEVAAYDARKEAQRKERDSEKASTQAFAELCTKLSAKFPAIRGAQIYVAGDRSKNRFSVQMHGLTQEQVERIAHILNPTKPGPSRKQLGRWVADTP